MKRESICKIINGKIMRTFITASVVSEFGMPSIPQFSTDQNHLSAFSPLILP